MYMMQDTYKDMGKGFNPSKADTDTFFNVMDTNKDGRITLQDLEKLAVKFLAGIQWEEAASDQLAYLAQLDSNFHPAASQSASMLGFHSTFFLLHTSSNFLHIYIS